jgi:predicted membrane channel-forming protein YqfA (hemolysin III family)
MSKLQSFAIGLVMAAMGVAALLQVIQVDHVLRLVSIAALGMVSLLGAMVFFVFSFRS